MERKGMVIGVNAEKIAEYKRLHAEVWPDVLKMITECNIRNYVIYLREPENLLFAHFEYHGADFEADMKKMAADPVTRKWWDVCMPCQRPFDTRKDGEWWAEMEEVFFHD
ncbi:L-rhamnose mutarotase [Qingshengfaniella alkalisoli]|uniref:L-rhamnose mutarotase n=1 Tax=Qingshengfaniella alkalisoli TaxID=2599296 RepID=A0A5B8IBD7_9RHOB|nr:L-rhamnose mutarotase [Qingshengfaniella alkalisoli]QDY71509.1 L-rhamnose mutarotase [Qingshengfaniella alkalisoli]